MANNCPRAASHHGAVATNSSSITRPRADELERACLYVLRAVSHGNYLELTKSAVRTNGSACE
eukprot:CAMPEP_0115881640 /NCGR_PEP_ID=MMETSP0287-20121206/28555_1 /TAXON_ID=412157 /ORGANISM="Chrysochromulina rotalis, Strain UIO044" /LENGTH=62 /DNA_ID=CAMNT_0003337617 /DNA_START=24 /DNA_END=212 /DNA_ORIENTATION=+